MNRKIKTMGTGELAKKLKLRKEGEEGKDSPSFLSHARQSQTLVAGASPLQRASFHCQTADGF